MVEKLLCRRTFIVEDFARIYEEGLTSGIRMSTESAETMHVVRRKIFVNGFKTWEVGIVRNDVHICPTCEDEFSGEAVEYSKEIGAFPHCSMKCLEMARASAKYPPIMWK